jgi:diguanylate cyclase (GGDEF)-like protein
MRTSTAASLSAAGIVAATAIGGVAVATATAVVWGNALLRRRLRATRAALAAARYAALHDARTGLVNRAGIDVHLSMCAAGDEPVWLLLVDLDGFKPVNDTYSHAAGDVVLVEVARRLSQAGDALVGRFGGDEFLIVCDRVPDLLAAEVVAAVRRPITVRSGVQVRVTASVGLVRMRPGDDPGDALHTADTALYRAKAAGGNQAVSWGDEPLRTVEVPRPLERLRATHPHRVPSELGVVVAR